MKTEILRLSAAEIADEGALRARLAGAAQLLREGECVAFPTETVYGLGALAENAAAVGKIFAVKGRPSDNPLILHVNTAAELAALVRPLSALQRALIEAFSPGPITYVLPKRPAVSDLLTAGLATVALRIPAHPVARALIAAAGAAIAAPSANLSGSPSPTLAAHVFEDLAGRIPLIIDGGGSEVGLESTVLDLSDAADIRILRHGAVTAEQLIAFLEGREDFRPAREDWRAQLVRAARLRAGEAAPRSPGMKYRHYAPRAPLRLIAGANEAEKLADLQREVLAAGEGAALGFFLSEGLAARWREARSPWPDQWQLLSFPDLHADRAASAELFAALRDLDRARPALILAEALPNRGMGAAYMERLSKASAREAQAAPAEPAAPDKRLLFLCTGNTCRSPLAALLFNKLAAQAGLAWRAESAGLAAFAGDRISEGSAAVLAERYGIDAGGHRARRLNPVLADEADLILTMSEGQAEALGRLLPALAPKTFSLGAYLRARGRVDLGGDVPDPYGRGAEAYADMADRLEPMLRALLELLGGEEG